LFKKIVRSSPAALLILLLSSRVLGDPSSGKIGIRMPGLTAAPTEVSYSSECQKAYHCFYGDRYDEAMDAVEAALAKNPRALASLLLKSQILAAGLEFEQAEALLLGLDRSFPRNPHVLLRRAELVRDQAALAERAAGSPSALELYESTLSVAPGNSAIALSFASYLYLINQLHRADVLYREAVRLRPFQDRETVMNDAMILTMKGQGEESLRELAKYRTTFGEDSQHLLAEGVVLWKLDRKGPAADRLTRACRKNVRNLAGLRAAAPLLIKLGQPDQVRALLAAAVAANPGNRRLAQLSLQLESPLISHPGVLSGSVVVDRPSAIQRRGAIVYNCSLPVVKSDRSLLDSIDGEFQAAFTSVAKLLGFTPNAVKVNVEMDTGLANPAFYDPRTDCITISAKWFNFKQPGIDVPLTPVQLRELTRHVVRHELSHLVLAHKIGLEEYQRGSSALPLWLVEGFAEWAAGGAQNVCRSPKQIHALFQAGLLDYEALRSAMLVNGESKDPDLNHKAYVQSFFIVKHLIGRKPDPVTGLEAFVGLIRALVRGGTTFEGALARQYRVSVAEFEAGWTGLLRDNVLLRADPILSSTP